ncbi:MAG TPA: MATE family efflux transporter [Roseiflexaceae bacterium]|nr:MATE family efflux transporter [Roseiflexaceae bacterium]
MTHNSFPQSADTPPVLAASIDQLPPQPAAPTLERRVLGLAAPVIGENLLQTMLGVVDTILVAGLGAVALAGVGAALQVIYVIIAALSALSVGASVLVAQAFGAGDTAAASRFARQSLLWSVILAAPIALLGLWLTPAIIAMFGLEPDVARVAEQYLHVTIATIVALTTALIGGGVLRGVGDSRTPMLITLMSNVINVALAYALIYGHFGLPALGAVGSAWATFFARLAGAVLLVIVLWRGRNGVRIGGTGDWWPRFWSAREVLRIGLPAALEEVLIIGAFAMLTPVVAGLGTVALAAHRVVINALSLSFLPGIGFGLAATALVGQSIGAHRADEAQAITRIAVRWAVIWMGALGVIFLLFATQIMRIFTDDAQMIAIGSAAMRVVALTQPLWAASFVYAGALRGTGNTRTPLLITGVAIWTAVGLGTLGMWLIQPSLAVLWGAFLIAGPAEAFWFWWAWRKWRRSER